MSLYSLKKLGREVSRRIANQLSPGLEIPGGIELPSRAAPTGKPPPEIVARRRGVGAEALLPQTEAWLDQLPEPIRPGQLALRFPRIANSLGAIHDKPDAWRRYTQELQSDRRGPRQGFPVAVENELQQLFYYYVRLRPNQDSAWEWQSKNLPKKAG